MQSVVWLVSLSFLAYFLGQNYQPAQDSSINSLTLSTCYNPVHLSLAGVGVGNTCVIARCVPVFLPVFKVYTLGSGRVACVTPIGGVAFHALPCRCLVPLPCGRCVESWRLVRFAALWRTFLSRKVVVLFHHCCVSCSFTSLFKKRKPPI